MYTFFLFRMIYENVKLARNRNKAGQASLLQHLVKLMKIAMMMMMMTLVFTKLCGMPFLLPSLRGLLAFKEEVCERFSNVSIILKILIYLKF